MKIQSITPQLRTTNFDATIRFYTQLLGFEEQFRFQDFYAGLALGDQLIHVKRVDTVDPSVQYVRDEEHLHFYLDVEDADHFSARLADAGVRLVRTPHDTGWGTREVTFEDDQGHRLVAGHRIEGGT